MEKLSEEIEKRGYKLVKPITPDNRHFLIKKGRTSFFLKLAKSDRKIHFFNEIFFNQQINKISKKSFRVPKIIETGRIYNTSYYISEYFPSEACFYKNEKVSNSLIKYVPLIIDFMIFLRNLKLNMPLDIKGEEKDFGYTKRRILELAKKYQKDIDRDCGDLILIIKNTKFSERCLAHREIKPKHLFKLDKKLGIIDAEWATNNIAEHYDLAACYARTFILGKPEIADEILKQYVKSCKAERINLEGFNQQFRGILALRAIGQYRDVFKSTGVTNYHLELIRKVLKKNLFNQK